MPWWGPLALGVGLATFSFVAADADGDAPVSGGDFIVWNAFLVAVLYVGYGIGAVVA